MTHAPKRRWFRFSLRTMFVVVTTFAIGGFAVRTVWPQKEPQQIPNSVWDELSLGGTLHMKQRQAERIGIKGPLDRMREAAWDDGDKVFED